MRPLYLEVWATKAWEKLLAGAEAKPGSEAALQEVTVPLTAFNAGHLRGFNKAIDLLVPELGQTKIDNTELREDRDRLQRQLTAAEAEVARLTKFLQDCHDSGGLDFEDAMAIPDLLAKQ